MPPITERIALDRTARFNKLILDLMAHQPQVAPFSGPFHGLDAYCQKLTERANFPVDRVMLREVIAGQYRGAVAQAEVEANIASLADQRTFTVCTGHQLNLFTGPLYFVHKIVHTLKLAQALGRAYPEHHFVPVFWLNSEDHDLEEVGQATVFGEKLVWNTTQAGPTGRMITHGIPEMLQTVAQRTGLSQSVQALLALFQEAYPGTNTLVEATRHIAHTLFGPYGLVMIDGDDARFKAWFAPVMLRDLMEHQSFENVTATSKLLADAGYTVQVNPREINLFYMGDGFRERIVRDAQGFQVLGTDIRFSVDEMQAELLVHPERFSPNVVLRPMYQEHLLPNLTYVGGAGEIAYWLQDRPNFEAHGISFPLLSLRSHWLIVDERSNNRMRELGLNASGLFTSIEDLIRDYVLSSATENLDIEAEQLAQNTVYNLLIEKAKNLDPTLVAALEAERIKQQKQLDGWRSRLLRVVKQREEVTVGRIRKLHQTLFPNGNLQERHDNIIQHWHAALISDLLAETNPFTNQFGVLMYEGVG